MIYNHLTFPLPQAIDCSIERERKEAQEFMKELQAI